MYLLYIYFAANAALVIVSVYYLARRARGVRVRAPNGGRAPVWVDLSSLGIGVVGILASAPSVFTDNPHWFVDKLFYVVSKVIEAVTPSTS